MKKATSTNAPVHYFPHGIMMRMFALLTVMLAMFFMTVISASARDFPLCTDAKVESRVLMAFNQAERRHWQRGIEMSALEKLHEHRTESFENSIISRRYCMATGFFSDGKRRPVYYMINDHGGFVGLTWSVNHCVIGLDPWRIYDGNCRAIR